MTTCYDRQTTTGFHLMMGGFELQQGYSMFDETVQPLDAPSMQAAGSMFKYEPADGPTVLLQRIVIVD